MKERLVLLKHNQIEEEIGKNNCQMIIQIHHSSIVCPRYKDIVPYDYNRVPVVPPYKISGDNDPSDYINASFISDVFTGSSRKYIAAQGPGTDTTPAFWQMIWQYGVQVVVMLTSVVEAGTRADGSTAGLQYIKCNKYWPDNVGDSKKFGDLQVQLFDKAEVRSAKKQNVLITVGCVSNLCVT